MEGPCYQRIVFCILALIFSIGDFIDAIVICDHLLWFEYICVSFFTCATIFARMAFYCTIACHDLPAMYRGLGDKTIYMVRTIFSYITKNENKIQLSCLILQICKRKRSMFFQYFYYLLLFPGSSLLWYEHGFIEMILILHRPVKKTLVSKK